MACYGRLCDILRLGIFRGNLEAGLQFLAGLNKSFLRDKPEGYSEKIILKKGAIFAVHQVYMSKFPDQARFEAHRQYIDIQYIWDGNEIISIASRNGLKRITRYDRENDIEFFEYTPASTLIMDPGSVAILFPEDAHAPSITLKKPGLVRKTVVKVSPVRPRLKAGAFWV